MDTTPQIQIFSVEDNQVLRTYLRSFLKQIDDFNLIGEAENAEKAMSAIAELKPEVILVDIGLPDINGIEVTRRIKKLLPKSRVLMLTASENADDIFQSLDAGADGYVLKGHYSINLEMAIRSVRIGAVWLDPAIARLVLNNTKRNAESQAQVVAVDTHEAECFSDKDIERLDQVAASNCRDGVCLVDPGFMARLREVNKQEPNSQPNTSDAVKLSTSAMASADVKNCNA